MSFQPILIRLALSVCLFTSCPVIAQESRANLEGRVVDPEGSAVPGAEVTVVSESTNVVQRVSTNEQGVWSVRFLNPGSYRIQVTAAGFKSVERKNTVLQTADIKRVDVKLELGVVSETVTITAEAPLIDTSAATAGTVVTGEALADIPMMSRIPFQLATLSPGVQAVDQNNNVAMMWSKNAASEIRVNGGRDNRSNEFLLDGMPNQNGDKVAFIPPADAVSEFRIMTNAYDAQYGRQSGSTMNVSLKNGGQNYHGNLYEFNRNDYFGANTFQANRSGLPKAPTRYNLYGGTFGGPVSIPKLYKGREKTFFFVSWEGIRNKDPRSGLRTVPDENERQGDFNGSFTTQVIGNNRIRIPTTIFDPLTVDSRRTITNTDGTTAANPQFGFRQPFAGNRIPANRISPIAAAVLQFVPLPNTVPQAATSNTANNFTPSSTRQNKMATFLTRVDQNWSDRHKSFVSIRWNHMDEFTGDDFHNSTTGNSATRINQGGGVDHVWIMSAERVLNLRFNVTRYVEPNFDNGAGFDPAALGFDQGYVSKMEKLSFPRFTGLFGDIGGSAGGYANTTYYNWNVNLTEIRGNVTFKYGGEYRILQEAGAGYGYQSGLFDFNSNWTRRRYDAGETGYGSTMASFLLGLPGSGSLPRNASSIDSQRYLGVFGQADWRVNSKLTVNVGLRWDYQRPFTERFDRRVSDFDPTTLNPVSDAAQAAYAGVLKTVLANPAQYPFGSQLASLVPVDSFKVYGTQLFAGVDGQPRTATNTAWDQWQPRVGAAYRIGDRTVLRGGFGKFYQSSGSKQGQNGFGRSTALVNSLDSGLTPFDTLAQPFQGGILEPTGSSLGPLTNLGNGVNWMSRDGHLPYSWEYSLHLQHEWKGWLFQGGYTHNKTSDISSDLQQNDIGFANWNTYRAPRFDTTGRPLAKPSLLDEQVPNPFYKLPGVTGSRGNSTLISIYDLMRPLTAFGGQVRGGNQWGTNQYDAFEAKIEKRFSRGFSFLMAYTFSKLFEDTSFWGAEISGPITEHKLGGEDRPHKISIAPVWQLPIGRGKMLGRDMPKWLDLAAGGWQLSGQYVVQSGAPVVFATNSFFDGQEFGYDRDTRNLDAWFDTSHFIRFPNQNDNLALWPAWTGVQNLPGAGYVPQTASDPKNGVYADFANYVRRFPTRWAHVRSSNVNELNAGLFKNFAVTERFKVQLRGEFFNVMNKARFGVPNTDPGSAAFGQVTPSQQNQPRVIQLALKISF